MQDNDRGICSDFCGHRVGVGGLRSAVPSIAEHDSKTSFNHSCDTASRRGSHHPPVANIRHPVTAFLLDDRYFETAPSKVKARAADRNHSSFNALHRDFVTK